MPVSGTGADPLNVARVIDALRERLGGGVAVGHALREQHSHGEGLPLVGMPDSVVFPTSTEAVAEIVMLCAANRIPIVPVGAGTSLQGHVTAVKGGICITRNATSAPPLKFSSLRHSIPGCGRTHESE